MNPFFLIAGALSLAPGLTAGAPVPRADYHAWQDEQTGKYCVRPTTYEEAERFGTGVEQRKCQSAEHWAREGLTFERASPSTGVKS